MSHPEGDRRQGSTGGSTRATRWAPARCRVGRARADHDGSGPTDRRASRPRLNL